MLKKVWKKEKRLSERLPVYHLAKYRNTSDAQRAFVVCTVKDISEVGIRCYVKEAIPKGSVLELQIQFPFLKNPETCTASVIRCQKRDSKGQRYEIGLKFNGIDDFLTRALAKKKDLGATCSALDSPE